MKWWVVKLVCKYTVYCRIKKKYHALVYKHSQTLTLPAPHSFQYQSVWGSIASLFCQDQFCPHYITFPVGGALFDCANLKFL